MDLIIKIIFILSMFVFNISMLNLLFKMTDEAKQKVGFMLLPVFNVLVTTGVLYVLHPYMAGTGVLAFSGFVGGGIVFVASVWIAITIE